MDRHNVESHLEPGRGEGNLITGKNQNAEKMNYFFKSRNLHFFDSEYQCKNNAFEFVDKTLKIINSKELALRITKNARHLIESRYYWESIVKNIEVSIKNLSSAEVNN